MIAGKRKLIESAMNAASKAVTDSLDDLTDVHPNETERLIFSAIQIFTRIARREHVEAIFLPLGEDPPPGIEQSLNLYIAPQHSIDPTRFDFAVFAYDHRGRSLGQPGWRRMVVECEFGNHLHPLPEETDRLQLHQTMMHLSSRNIQENPWGCAEAILSWAAWSFG